MFTTLAGTVCPTLWAVAAATTATATSNVRIFDMAALDYRAEDERTRQFKGLLGRLLGGAYVRASPACPTGGPRGLSSQFTPSAAPPGASQVRTRPRPVRL